MASCFCVLIFMRCIAVKTSSWTSRSDLLRADNEVAVGSINGTIFLIGGYKYPRQITKYQINSQQFINLGRDAIVGGRFRGSSQYWTQQQHIIYAIDGDQLNIYNMRTNEYVIHWEGITFDQTTCDRFSCYACLASSSSFLYVTGGANIDTLQILSLASHAWIQNAPSMNTVRAAHACIAHNDYLFVFGGLTSVNKLTATSSNERIRITNIIDETWSDVDPLMLELQFLRAVSLDDLIYIIGGMHWYNNGYEMAEIQTTIHLMDANTGSVTVFADALPSPNVYGSPIVVNGVLFVMSGFHDSEDINYSDYYNPNYYFPNYYDTDIIDPNYPTNDYAYYPLSTMSSTSTTSSTTSTSASASTSTSSSQFTTTLSSSLRTFNLSVTQISVSEISPINTLDTKMTNDTLTENYIEQALSPNEGTSSMLLYIAASVISGCILMLCVMCIRAGWKQRKEAMPQANKVRSLSEQHEKALSNIMNDNDENDVNDEDEIHAMDVVQDSIKDKAQLTMIEIEAVELFERKKEREAVMKSWLEHIVGLPQYYTLFVENGFENMKFVKNISNILNPLQIRNVLSIKLNY